MLLVPVPVAETVDVTVEDGVEVVEKVGVVLGVIEYVATTVTDGDEVAVGVRVAEATWLVVAVAVGERVTGLVGDGEVDGTRPFH